MSDLTKKYEYIVDYRSITLLNKDVSLDLEYRVSAIESGGGGGGGDGCLTFKCLSDTPSDFNGAGKFAIINATNDGITFTDVIDQGTF